MGVCRIQGQLPTVTEVSKALSQLRDAWKRGGHQKGEEASAQRGMEIRKDVSSVPCTNTVGMGAEQGRYV